jgi:UDP-N-acetylglucosamine--N-acetylmuramyl-(pentapeptide) pyrophosphoryl-undecaprenol N-acetylglucosamine transferase
VDFDDVKEFYETKGLNAVVYSFLDRIDLAYAAADVAVSRSGAAAVFELAYYGKAMILVPYPNPKNNQRSNAEYFESRGAAVYRDEKRLSASVLSGELFDILADDEKRRRLSFSAERLSRPAAARFFADKVLEVVSGKKGRSV